MAVQMTFFLRKGILEHLEILQQLLQIYLVLYFNM